MKNDDTNHGDSVPSDEFWGSTPDWSDSMRRPRRERSESRGDITGAIKGLWSSAMSTGAAGTREHRVLDANAPRPSDDTPVIGPTMFDDLDTEIPLWNRGRVASVDAATPTGEIPVIAAGGPPPFDVDADDDVDDRFAAMTPVPLVEQNDNRRGSSKAGLDPLLVRIGTAAVVTSLLVPFAIGWTSDDGDDTIASAADQVTATSEVTTPPSSEASTTAAAEPERQVLDPEDLPPAVVVNPSPESDSSTSSSSSSSSTSSSSSSSSSSTSSSSVAETTSVAAAATDTCAIDYEVQFGDFWLRLAEGADVSLSELLEANGATTDTPLYPESTICLPAGAATPPPPAPPTTAAPTTAAPTTAAPTTAAPTTAAPTTAAPTTAAPTTAAPTTAAPTTAAPPPPPPPAGPEGIKQIIRDVWPDHLEDRALTIAYRESRYVPTAQNYCCYGLFQIYWSVHRSWLDDLGITSSQQLFDPATNARAAYALYQRAGGWGPWSMTAY